MDITCVIVVCLFSVLNICERYVLALFPTSSFVVILHCRTLFLCSDHVKSMLYIDEVYTIYCLQRILAVYKGKHIFTSVLKT